MLTTFLPNVITDEENCQFLKTSTKEEIWEIIFAFNPSKAPGPDGFSAKLFQYFRPILKSDITRFVRETFEEGKARSGGQLNFNHPSPEKGQQ